MFGPVILRPSYVLNTVRFACVWIVVYENDFASKICWSDADVTVKERQPIM